MPSPRPRFGQVLAMSALFLAAVAACGDSPTSSPDGGGPNPSTPLRPTGLTVVAVSDIAVDVSWTDNSDDELGFAVERCAGSGCTGFSLVGGTAFNETTFRDEGLSGSTTYRYRVQASNIVGNSGYSDPAEATTGPAAPSSLAASPAGPETMTLSWADNSSDETGFELERCSGFGCADFEALTSVAADATGHTDTGLQPETTYRYRVRAAGAVVASEFSTPAEATTPAADTPPTAPTDLTATAISTSDILLEWTDNSGDETGFRIQSCEGSGCTNFTEIGTIGRNADQARIGGLDASTTYRYRISAFNDFGDSPLSNTASATTPASTE